MDKAFPYFCETEIEYMQFEKRESPVLKGYTDGMLDLAAFYTTKGKGECPHPYKAKYWKKKLKKSAAKGNLEAQGILCSRRAKFAFKESEIEQFRADYEHKLWQLAGEGNPYAQLSVGKYLTPYLSQESFDYLNRAAEQGLTDAWYSLGKQYYYFPEKSRRENLLLSKEDEVNYRKKAEDCYYKGAVADKGIMATWCQIRAGENFEDGEYGERDYLKARFWYEKALENGDKEALSKIKLLEDRMDYQIKNGERVLGENTVEYLEKVKAYKILGDVYFQNKVISRDMNKAITYYKKSIEEGNFEASYDLAAIYLSDEFRRTPWSDMREGVYWAKLSLEHSTIPDMNICSMKMLTSYYDSLLHAGGSDEVGEFVMKEYGYLFEHRWCLEKVSESKQEEAEKQLYMIASLLLGYCCSMDYSNWFVNLQTELEKFEHEMPRYCRMIRYVRGYGYNCMGEKYLQENKRKWAKQCFQSALEYGYGEAGKYL